MIRPHHFTPNQMTAYDNVFQAPALRPAAEIAASAYAEVTAAAERLRAEGVRVHLFDDEETGRPDAVFPNNWFSTHADGRVVLYPMHAPNRRTEQRGDVLAALQEVYRVREIVDYSPLAERGVFLEGTGAMVLDHVRRIAYVARSLRADPVALARFCRELGYRAELFEAKDSRGVPIYHTNVMMAVGTRVAVIALGTIRSRPVRERVARLLRADGARAVVELREEQMGAFAGNVLELATPTGPILAMSTTAHRALDPQQRAVISARCRIVALDVPTIELAGGSVRCMLAGIHLPPRHPHAPGLRTHGAQARNRTRPARGQKTGRPPVTPSTVPET